MTHKAMNLKERLRRLEKNTRQQPVGGTPFSKEKTEADFTELAERLEGTLEQCNGHPLISVTNRVPLQGSHGAKQLQSAPMISGETLQLLSKNKVPESFDIKKALFVDTETTGLAGPSGTYVFLLGLGWIEQNEFVVEQHFLPKLASEPALLFLLSERMRQRNGLVTFNGKSYDIPLLAGRCIQHRITTNIDLHPHFDVLHAARRLWKDDFGSATLTTLEKHVLNLHRTGDIPGEEIPGIYKAYLMNGIVSSLPPILYHNRMDIITLLALTVEMVGLAEKSGDPIPHRQASRVAALHENANKRADAIKIWQKVGLSDDKHLAREARLRSAAALKREGRLDEAVEIWKNELNTASGGMAVKLCIELAKYYEHRERNYQRALIYTERAARIVRMIDNLEDNSKRITELEPLLHRRNRLLSRIRQKEKGSSK